MQRTHSIAYFSMEIGVHPDIPTYSGGLGMLAGDCLRSAADLALPICAVTLLHRRGYFQQSLDAAGQQHEEPVRWDPANHMKPVEQRTSIKLRGRKVHLAAWRFDVQPSHSGGAPVPVYFLDADLPENHEDDRRLTDQLYGGDHFHRLLQEAVLGIGGVHLLRDIGLRGIRKFHMNEGHAALLTIELLAEHSFDRKTNPADPEVISSVRNRCVFTTHTPVPAGHDRFSLADVFEALGEQSAIYDGAPYCPGGQLNMSRLAMHYSTFSNGVARRHGEVSRRLLENDRIEYVTNGVHAPTWASDEIATLLDAHCTGWRADHRAIRRAMFIPDAELAAAHGAAKRRLIDRANRLTGAGLSSEAFTIGFARRATGYKRADLLLSEPDRLIDMARRHGPIQIIYGGKAHPRDLQGKEIIRKISAALKALSPHVRGVYMPNYDFTLCRAMVAGVDLWVNTPIPPMEASGTSGMKAALNGVPSLSTPDGWWLEGALEGLTGWTIGRDEFESGAYGHDQNRARRDAHALYQKLDREILPTFFHDRRVWGGIMRTTMAANGSQFNTNRVMLEYAALAYGIAVP